MEEKCEYRNCNKEVYSNDKRLRGLCKEHFFMVVEGREPEEEQMTL